MAKCRLCPMRRTCRDECYGETPCAFALAFHDLGLTISRKEVCIESLMSERDEAMKKVPEHRVFGDYVLTPVPNAFNGRTSWWISKKGLTTARYCFTASDEKEIQRQIEDGLTGYIKLMEST